MNDNTKTGSNSSRPSVLNDVSETQIMELERQFEQGDHDDWNTLGQSYGWSAEQCQAVWNWFGERPDESESNSGGVDQ